MNLKKSNNRDNKLNKRRHGMIVDSRSVFTIQRLQKERAEQLKKERQQKEKLLETVEE